MAINQNFRSEEGFVVGNNTFTANTVFLTGIVPITTIFTSNGTYIKNANLLYAEIKVIGGGGSGGGTTITTTTTVNPGGSGAGTVEGKLTTTALRSGGEPVIVGVGGSNNNGTNSSFGNNTSSFTPLVAIGGLVSNSFARPFPAFLLALGQMVVLELVGILLFLVKLAVLHIIMLMVLFLEEVAIQNMVLVEHL